MFAAFLSILAALSWAQEKQEVPEAAPSAQCSPQPLFAVLMAVAEGSTMHTAGDRHICSPDQLKECCQDNVLPLILPLRPCKHFWATKCSVNFLCCFTQHQFFKADQLQECLQHFSTAASIKHLRSLLMSQTGIQPYTCWGVTDPWWRSPSGISVEQAVGMQLAGSPARSCSLLSRGAMASHAQDALRMHKRVQKFIKNPNHVLVSSMLCLEWPWAIAQYSSCHCGSCLEWLGMNVSCAGDFSIFFMCWSWQRVAVIWGLLHYPVGRGTVLLRVPVTGWKWGGAAPIQHLWHLRPFLGKV